jgi:hypothetical protein
MNIDEIKNQFVNDCKFDPTQLDVESLRTHDLFSKYGKIYHDERLVLHKLKSKLALERKLRWEYYTGKIDPAIEKARGWKPFGYKVLRNEVDMYLEADEILLEIQDRIALQEEKVRMIEGIIKTIHGRQWDIRNAIEWKKWSSGIT